MDWTLVFWGCFLVGILLTALSWIIGDLLEGLTEGITGGSSMFHPVVWVGALTAFGAAGLILSKTTPLEGAFLSLSALGLSVVASVLLYLLVVKPMENAESSVGFRMSDLIGRQGEVITAIPAEGCGELLVWTGGGHTNQIASSLHHHPIPQGARVIIRKVEESVLWVTPVEPYSDEGVNQL
ncbi:nodulation efficiency protein D [Desmospora sp. 8437]|nr:nodulation efficiency protein D [Desmospora sp. 8437]